MSDLKLKQMYIHVYSNAYIKFNVIGSYMNQEVEKVPCTKSRKKNINQR